MRLVPSTGHTLTDQVQVRKRRNSLVDARVMGGIRVFAWEDNDAIAAAMCPSRWVKGREVDRGHSTFVIGFGHDDPEMALFVEAEEGFANVHSARTS